MTYKNFLIPIIILFIVVTVLGVILLVLTREQAEAPVFKPAERGEVTEEGAVQGPSTDQGFTQPPTVVLEETVTREFADSFLDTGSEAVRPSEPAATQAEITLLVRNFLEDYGSFSTNSGYAHIKDWSDQMTSKFRTYTQDWLLGDPASLRSPQFYSIQTIVVEVRIEEFSSNKARLRVETKRIETDVPAYYNKQFKQGAEITLLRIGPEWKVSSVYWK